MFGGFDYPAIGLKSDRAEIFCVSQTYLKKEQNADIKWVF